MKISDNLITSMASENTAQQPENQKPEFAIGTGEICTKKESCSVQQTSIVKDISKSTSETLINVSQIIIPSTKVAAKVPRKLRKPTHKKRPKLPDGVMRICAVCGDFAQGYQINEMLCITLN